MTLIGVKSKYGSCSGNCTGLIIYNYITVYVNIYKGNFHNWQDGLSCKLNSIVLLRVRISCFLSLFVKTMFLSGFKLMVKHTIFQIVFIGSNTIKRNALKALDKMINFTL